ncbi:substrate-binding domain-containing protein [Kiritimatiellota bacterium B12222]|nr:substrate-binding domain-containing protein [Kiritimatiellota bacterium B12222]
MASNLRHIGILMDVSTGEGREMVRGAAAYARQRANWEIVFPCFESQGLDPVNIPYWCDGLLLRPLKLADQEACLEFKGPKFGLVWRGIGSRGIPFLTTQGKEVARMAFRHLRENGIERMGVVGFKDSGFSYVRSRSFQHCVDEAGLEGGEFEVVSPPDRSLLIQWLKGWKKPFGIFATNDMLAREVVNCALEAGILIPGQLSVIGAGNDDTFCTVAGPTLSSVDPGAYRIGYEGARRLDLLMKGETLPRFGERLPPLGVITRESTHVAFHDPLIADILCVIRDEAPRGLQVSDLLERFPVSKSTLNRKFRESTGKSPSEEIQRVRLARAKFLLRSSDLSNEHIAVESGYPTPKAFYLALRADTGMTPRAFRNHSGRADR